jgi:hypothetical protein
VGMSVHVATREHKSKKFWSEISQVGVQIETITNSLAIIREGALLDAGLPVIVDVPKGMQIRPGESVDLTFKPRPALPLPGAQPEPPAASSPGTALESGARGQSAKHLPVQ